MLKENLNTDFPVDIVYTWVDDQDTQWQEKKKNVLTNLNINPEANEACRFVNNNELLFSIRSIYKYCSWFNKIYIITDSQIPKWLNTNNSEIVIIDHKTIFGNAGILPTFNSNVIESRIHHIPSLCEHYIYFNDDFFIGRKLCKSFFFSETGMPKLYMTQKKSKRKVLKDMKPEKLLKQKLYPLNLNLARKLVLDKCKSLILHYPIHNPKAFRKSDILKVENIFNDEIKKTLQHQFRNKDGIYFLALCLFYLIAQEVKVSIIKPYRKDNFLYNISYFCRYRDFIYIKLGWDNQKRCKEKYRLIHKYKPAFFCLNDGEESIDLDREIMIKFLSEYFPKKINAEK